MTLNVMCTAPARTASRGLPMDARRAVTHVPMFAPKMSAIPAGSVMSPWLAMTMIIPVVADELCTGHDGDVLQHRFALGSDVRCS